MTEEQKPGFEWEIVRSVDEMERFYNRCLPAIREAARAQGYAIGLHGSMRRDLDLIAVPWVAVPAHRDELAKAIHLAACGTSQTAYQWERKPFGRHATSMPICWPEWEGKRGIKSLGCIDLSVMGEYINAF